MQPESRCIVASVPSLDKDTHAFRRCKSALTASSSLAYASMPASSSLPSSDFPSPKSPVEFLRGRNAVGGSAAKMAGWRLPMNRAMPYGIYARKNRMCSCQAKVRCPEINLIQPQDVVEAVRYFVCAVLIAFIL